jgi:hypothetical protein
MTIQGPGASSGIQFDSIAKTIGTGDMEGMLIAFGIERAQTMEQAVKAKIADMRSRNAEIQDLQAAMQYFRAAKPGKDEKGKSFEVNGNKISPDNAEFQRHKAVLEKHGLYNGIKEVEKRDWMGRPTGEKTVELAKKGGFRDLIANMESKIDELTSNDQLDMITLQSMVSKQNNAIEMVSNLTSKFAQLNDKIVGNMR